MHSHWNTHLVCWESRTILINKFKSLSDNTENCSTDTSPTFQCLSNEWRLKQYLLGDSRAKPGHMMSCFLENMLPSSVRVNYDWCQEVDESNRSISSNCKKKLIADRNPRGYRCDDRGQTDAFNRNTAQIWDHLCNLLSENWP